MKIKNLLSNGLLLEPYSLKSSGFKEEHQNTITQNKITWSECQDIRSTNKIRWKRSIYAKTQGRRWYISTFSFGILSKWNGKLGHKYKMHTTNTITRRYCFVIMKSIGNSISNAVALSLKSCALLHFSQVRAKVQSQ